MAKHGSNGSTKRARRKKVHAKDLSISTTTATWSRTLQELESRRGTLQIWAEPFTVLRIPKLYNLRTDPFERADTTSNSYWKWYLLKGYMMMAAQALVVPFLETFKAFPPTPASGEFHHRSSNGKDGSLARRCKRLTSDYGDELFRSPAPSQDYRT